MVGVTGEPQQNVQQGKASVRGRVVGMLALQSLQMAVDVKKQTIHSALHKLVIESSKRFRYSNLPCWRSVALHCFVTKLS
jgi:hypothetical protein